MKKMACILFSLVLLFALAGCSGTAPDEELSSVPTSSATQQEEAAGEPTNSELADAENEAPSSAVDTDQEQDDPSARPAITGGVEDISQYDTVLPGYPIWLACHKLIRCTQLA